MIGYIEYRRSYFEVYTNSIILSRPAVAPPTWSHAPTPLASIFGVFTGKSKTSDRSGPEMRKHQPVRCHMQYSPRAKCKMDLRAEDTILSGWVGGWGGGLNLSD